MFENIVWIAVSLGLLFVGADWLVRGGADFARRVGLSSLVIGLTVVAFGTSAPELVVSTKAALTGHGDIAMGNVVGSNIFNVCVILGLSALVYPVRIQVQLLRLDAPIMVAVSVLLVFFLRDLTLDRLEAALLFVGMVSYTVLNIRLARREVSAEVAEEFAGGVPKATGSVGRDLVYIVGGLVALVFGSRLLVDNATDLAKLLGVGEAVIGLTIVAAGTSMPELATSAVAAWRKQPDICIGNVIGSNLFNLLGILGISGLLSPLHAPGVQPSDLWVMTGTALLVLPLMWSRFLVSRWEGTVLLGAYVGYVYALWPK